MNNERNIKSSQEQAIVSWINYLNQLRIDELIKNLIQQDSNRENAFIELENLMQSINTVIQSRRGGTNGSHGFIAERMQVYIENARSLVKGAGRTYELIDDNGPIDYWKGTTGYQQKFVQRNLGLDAIKEHMEKYPEFLKNGGKYHIPKNYYERIMYFLELSEEEAKKLPREEYRIWKIICNFFENREIKPEDIEPAVINYEDSQIYNVEDTLNNEKENIKQEDKKARERYYKKSNPSVIEAAKVAGVSAVSEGGISFCLNVYRKRKEGKHLSEFDIYDWREIGIKTGRDTAKGGVRGEVIYLLTNFTQTPAVVASALVTATYGMVAEAEKLKKGTIDQDTFLIHSEILCLDVTVSAISSVLGEMLIPIPVLGAVIGNVAGSYMYEIAQNYMSHKEQILIQKYNQEIAELNQNIDKRYTIFIEKLQKQEQKYNSMIELAFSLDVNQALAGSIKLAHSTGVASEKILKSKKEIYNFFTL